MKIGILTQPLHSNYGGLLQAWALQRTLVKMGHEAIIINRVYNPNLHKKPLLYRTLARIKNELLIAAGKRRRYLRVTDELKNLSEENVRKFRESRYKGISPNIRTNEELVEYVLKENFDAYVVGSDQVWRHCYSPNLMTYFLDFAKNNDKVKKIAYAASFGVDNWEFTKKKTKEAARLAPLFDLITVRESSGVDLVEKYFNCKATHVLDPTMLLQKEDYLKLIEKSTCPLQDSDGELFCYVLDKSPALTEAIKSCASSTGFKSYYCNYKDPYWKLMCNQNIEDCIVPPVEQWLKSFMDAKMVVTDSFHGVVFSIIFNKPFWVVANIERGTARFTSLLKLFSLENRIVSDPHSIDLKSPIDWSVVNAKRTALASKSLSLLSSYLH